MKLGLLALLLTLGSTFAQTLSPILTPRSLGLSGADVAAADDASGALFNPAGLVLTSGMTSDQSYGASTNHGTDRLLVSYANPQSEDGARFASGVYAEGQTNPADWKFYVPFLATVWQPLPRIAVGATLRVLNEIPRADSLDSKWTDAVDLGVVTPGKNLTMGARIEKAFGGTSAIPKTLQWGAAFKSTNKRLLISYEWSGDHLDGIKYRYASSSLGMEYLTGPYGIARAGYKWSDYHSLSLGAAIGLTKRGTLLQAGWSIPVEGGKNTEWAIGLSYKM